MSVADDSVPISPAAERNKSPILEVLRAVLPPRGLVLEIACGTGQHAVHFAQALPALTYQPSDADPDARAITARRVARAGLPNLRAPIDLDVRRRPWPVEHADAIVCINMIHIAPWSASEALFAGAGELLTAGCVLCTYGPYRRGGAHTAPSNEAFDASLRRQNPDWGVRDLEAVERTAAANGFAIESTTAMPANNFTVVFRRLGTRN